MIIQREIYNEIKKYIKSSQAIVVTGIRGVGKTTLIKDIYNNLESDNKLFLDLENPITQKYFEEIDYEDIVYSLKDLGLNLKKKSYVFLDEIQFEKNIPSIVKYLYDHYKVKFFLTDSSSYYLKNRFSESLAGRKYVFEMFPLSFQEFLLFKNSKLRLSTTRKVSEVIYEVYDQLYEEYLCYGGFPEIVLCEDFKEKKKLLQDVFTSYFQLEVVQFSDCKNTKIIRDLMLLLMERVGSRISVSRLSQELGVSRETVYNYLEFLEGTYFIRLIRAFSGSKSVEIRRNPKVYICDSGLLNILSDASKGAVFENNIFQSLAFRGDVNYYQKKSGQEIDFILDKKIAYEVKITPSTQDQKRLYAISEKIGIKEPHMVSKKYSNLKNVKYGFTI